MILANAARKPLPELVAGVKLRHDHTLARADRLESCTKSARAGVFDERHPEAL